MTSSSPSGSSGDDSDLNSVPPNSLAGLSLSIFSDLLANITHDIALQSHRSEKLLRTKQLHLLPPTTDGSPPPAANVNPLAIVPTEIICSRCHLPQHTAHTLETTTAAAQKKKFCPRLPFQDAPFHDIYGNPFPTVKETAGKKGDNNKAGDSPTEEGTAVTITTGNGKKGAAIYFKCTCCDKEKVAPSHFAKHLEKCLGLGRKSSRAAMAKMNNSNSGSGAGSPMLSAADATAQGSKTASRKPSPEKKSKSPVPLEEVAAPPPATPVLPPKPVFGTSVTDLAGGTPTPKKKKKKTLVAVTAAAAAKAASVPPEDDKGLLAMPEAPTKPIDVPSLPPLPPPALAKEPTQKKRKRKTDTLAAATADVAAATTTVGGEESRDAITVSLPVSKPPPKKQKLAMGEKPTGVDSVKKSQLSKFKNRTNSPSPGGGSSKKGETIRKSSPAPHASPPITHKSLPPKPPAPLTGPLAAPPMGASSLGATPKQRKPKPGALGGSAKKAAAAAAAAAAGAGAGTGTVGVGDGASPVKKVTKPKIKKVVSVAGKTVPVPRVPGKTVPVPGVARKGPKE